MSRHGFGRYDIGAQKLGNTQNIERRSDEESAAMRAVLLRTTTAVPAKKRLSKKQAHQVLDMLGLIGGSA
jgi:hypothetical protein